MRRSRLRPRLALAVAADFEWRCHVCGGHGCHYCYDPWRWDEPYQRRPRSLRPPTEDVVEREARDLLVQKVQRLEKEIEELRKKTSDSSR